MKPISLFDGPFLFRGSGELIAWSRILNDEEALCVINVHGTPIGGGDVVVDSNLNPEGTILTVIVNGIEAGARSSESVVHPVGSQLPVKHRSDGTAFVEIRDMAPSGVIVAVNHS